MTERPVLPLKEAYKFAADKGLSDEAERVRTMEIEWDLPYTSSLRRGYMANLFGSHGLFEEFKATYWPFGDTLAGKGEINSYLRKLKRYEDFLQTGTQSSAHDEADEVDDQAFAAESDLRDFLAKNPGCIEKGLRIYDSEGVVGAEFSIDEGKGRIDLLAIDGQGRFVVIELKLGRGRNRTLGQLLYYMGWVDKHLGKDPCRGIIIAKDIPEDLVLAAQRVPGVSLCNYNLSVSITPLSAAKSSMK
jgi:hypothetical protein